MYCQCSENKSTDQLCSYSNNPVFSRRGSYDVSWAFDSTRKTGTTVSLVGLGHFCIYFGILYWRKCFRIHIMRKIFEHYYYQGQMGPF